MGPFLRGQLGRVRGWTGSQGTLACLCAAILSRAVLHCYWTLQVKVDSDSWSHLCGVYDGKQMRMYLNGTLKDTYAQSLQYSMSSCPQFQFPRSRPGMPHASSHTPSASWRAKNVAPVLPRTAGLTMKRQRRMSSMRRATCASAGFPGNMPGMGWSTKFEYGVRRSQRSRHVPCARVPR